MQILFANELGGGLGHAHRLAPWVEALASYGHSAVCALRNIVTPGAGFFGGGTRVIQAPVLLQQPIGRRAAELSYAEILLSAAGYGNAKVLASLVDAWLALIDLCEARLLVADFAPSALLAARIRGIACVNVGDGYTIAPQGAAFGRVGACDVVRLRNADHRVITVVNEVLAAVFCPGIAEVADLQAADLTILATYPELDHYHDVVRELPYAGHFALHDQRGFEWSGSPGPRVVAYLNPEARNFNAIVGQLAKLRGKVHLYAGGVVRDSAPVAGYGLHWQAAPLPIPAALGHCDLVVSHGGHGLVCASLLAAKPLLIFPSNHEQTLTALNVERMGAGTWVHPDADVRKLGRVFERALNTAQWRLRASEFSATHGPAYQTATARLADHAEQIIGLATAPDRR